MNPPTDPVDRPRTDGDSFTNEEEQPPQGQVEQNAVIVKELQNFKALKSTKY